MTGVLVLAAVTIATALFVHSWTRLGARLDHDLPGLMDDPRDICQQRGYHMPKAVPGTSTTICGTCEDHHTHEPVAVGAYWLCGCGWNQRRHTALYRDERSVG